MQYIKNGQFCQSPSIHHNNRSFLYGDGFFESIRLFEGVIFNRESHFNRVSTTLKQLELELERSVNDVFSEVEVLAQKNGLLNACSARLTIYREQGGLYTPLTNQASYIISTVEHPEHRFNIGNGIRLGIYSKHLKAAQPLSTIKSSSALLYVLASIDRKKQIMDELILLNEHSNVVEGTNSNIFMVKDSHVFTPPLSDGGVAGTMRHLLLQQFNVEESSFQISDLELADEIFLTNCHGIRWVKEFGKNNHFNSDVSAKVVDCLNLLI